MYIEVPNEAGLLLQDYLNSRKHERAHIHFFSLKSITALIEQFNGFKIDYALADGANVAQFISDPSIDTFERDEFHNGVYLRCCLTKIGDVSFRQPDGFLHEGSFTLEKLVYQHWEESLACPANLPGVKSKPILR